jgi:hypothetical protein
MSIQLTAITTAGNIAYPSIGNSAVTYFALCNYTSSNVLASVYVVPNGQTIGNTNILLANLLLTGQETYFVYGAAEKLILSNGDSIQVVANANSAITTTISYTSI